MDLFLGGAYLILTAVSAHALVAALGTGATPARGHAIALSCAWLVSFAGIFFAPFFVIGALELLRGGPKISVLAALGVQTVATLVILVVRPRTALVGSRPRGLLQVRSAVSALGRASAWSNWGGGVAVVAIAVFLAIGALLAVGFPRGFEVKAYHLPIAVNIFQTGSLRVWDPAYMHTFPANMSLLSGFLLQILPERLVSAANLVFLLLACFAVYGLGRTLGGARGDSVLAAVGLASIPLIAFSAFELGADIGGSAFLGLAYVLVLAAPDRRPSWILLAGLAAGLAYGFKPLHLVGTTFLGAVVLCRAWLDPRRTSVGIGAARAAVSGSLLAAGFALSAGIWLLRSYLEFGNPLYPVHLGSLFDWLGWPSAPDVNYLTRVSTQFEWVDAPWQWLIYPWVEGHYIDQNFKHSSGLGAFFATVFPVSWAAAALSVTKRVVSRKRFSPEHTSLFTLATLVAGSVFVIAVWWALVDRQPRYLMGALVLGVPLFAWLPTTLSPYGAKALRAVAGAAIAVMLVVIVSKQFIAFGSTYIISKQFSRAAFYEYPPAVDRLPRGSVILNLGPRPANYHYYGSDLANRVLSSSALASKLREMDAEVITSAALCALGATHIATIDAPRYEIAPNIRLEVVDELVRNPTNNAKLPAPRTLYRIEGMTDLCAETSSDPPS